MVRFYCASLLVPLALVAGASAEMEGNHTMCEMYGGLDKDSMGHSGDHDHGHEHRRLHGDEKHGDEEHGDGMHGDGMHGDGMHGKGVKMCPELEALFPKMKDGKVFKVVECEASTLTYTECPTTEPACDTKKSVDVFDNDFIGDISDEENCYRITCPTPTSAHIGHYKSSCVALQAVDADELDSKCLPHHGCGIFLDEGAATAVGLTIAAALSSVVAVAGLL